MSETELLLVDLSAIAHQMWHVSQSEPDPDATATKTVDRVRALAASHPHAAVCCDSGRSFRHEIDPSYKAQRPQQEAPLKHQIALSRERLAADGFPVWSVKGFEADDLIATATARALAIDGTTVLIASADKDLLQLVGPRVRAKSTTTGDIADEAAVKAKFGVTPAQMRDYLSLVGDASDNVVGAKGIGPKRAAELLGLFETLDEVYAAVKGGNAKFPDGIVKSLTEFDSRRATVRELITLKTDVPIPFEEIAAERVAKDAAPLETPSMDDLIAVAEQPREEMPPTPERAADAGQPTVSAAREEPKQPQALAVRPDVLAPAPSEWGKQLEPRSLVEAQGLATAMYNARLFNGYGNAPAVLSTIMAGRELGLQAVASLRGFHIVSGRHCLDATLIRGLALKSGLARYFRCTERTPERATFVTKRGDDPEVTLSFTVEEGRSSFEGDDAKFAKSGWGKNPADMCVARAGAKLARLVYPEVTFGLYAPEEFDNGRG